MCATGAEGQKKAPFPSAFQDVADCLLFGLWRRLLLRLLLLLHVLVLLLHHGIELFLLIVVQSGANLVDSAFANGVDFLDLVFARHGGVLHYVHGLGVLIFQSCLYLCLLVGGKVQLLGQGLNLVVNAGTSVALSTLGLRCCSWLLLLARLNRAWILGRLGL